MNYRHHFHAGNFADVLKHLLLLRLLRALQRKEKGLLYLDTHSGRGLYDLAKAGKGDSLERKPEWPEGIGRLWSRELIPQAAEEYLALVKKCNVDHNQKEGAETPAFYPGSPWLIQAAARPQDRLVLCEMHPEECEVLRNEMSVAFRASVQLMDGYDGTKAYLPPPEKRALVLIDPPFETQDEFARIVTSLKDGLRRLPGGTFAVWYPLTERARIEAFFDELSRLQLPPCWTAELCIAGEQAGIKMRGCGLLVINPPWQLDREIGELMPWLCDILAQEHGAEARLLWLVPEAE